MLELGRSIARVRGLVGGVLDGVAPTPWVIAAGDPGQSGWEPDEAGAYCSRCGAPAGPGSVTPEGCPRCRGQRLAYHRVTRLGVYEEPLAGWVRAMKFGRQWRWAEHLGRRLGGALPPPPAGRPAVVVPVPMHRLRRVRRGYNQAELLARAVADVLGLPLLDPLRRTRHTPPQSLLPPSRRVTNLRDAVACGPVDLSGHTVYLIDDVKTTGTTLRTCARLLKGAGAPLVYAGVLAVADPSGQRFESLKPRPGSPGRANPTRPLDA